MNLAESHPCKARCPQCQGRCFNSEGHLRKETCGRKTLPEVHCCTRHCWGDLSDLREMLRANERECRREYDELMRGKLKSARSVKFATGG